jgi:hypothetical protein
VLPAQAIATLRGISLDALTEEFAVAGVIPPERPIPWADPAELPDVHVDLAALDADLAAAGDHDPAAPGRGQMAIRPISMPSQA